MEDENDNDDMDLNEDMMEREDNRPVPVSSTSSLDSFCLATADLMQECSNDGLHYNAVMDVCNNQSNVEASKQDTMTTGNNGGTESPTNTNTTTKLPNITSSSVISPGAGIQLKALLPPSMSLPQQQEQPSATNTYHPLVVAPPPQMALSISGTLAPPLGIGQHQQQPAPPQEPNSSTLVSVVSGTTNTSVPEFLFQLTRMLSDDNREVIEWSNGTHLCLYVSLV
jgi:hypothetical protein